MDELTLGTSIGLLLALGLALGFEFVNGFHDTANAVATVIYTHTLPARVAVVWSGLWNLIGVLVSSGAVAFSVLALLPVELLLQIGSAAGFAMVFALLISSILWNVGTWYLGLPASSSHTLIGSIIGVGIANSLLAGHGVMAGVNWVKARDVFLSLLLSPLVGFLLSLGLLWAARRYIRREELFRDPSQETGPPTYIRSILFLTCTGVSFAHGSNDGQKGMGLILLILIGLLPGTYAVNQNLPAAGVREIATRAAEAQQALGSVSPNAPAAREEVARFLRENEVTTAATLPALATKVAALRQLLAGRESLRELSVKERTQLRQDAFLLAEANRKLKKLGAPQPALDRLTQPLANATQYIPLWVKIAVAIALSLGTMIGWERIVITVGEKIGKTHLSYAQGAVAEMSAMTTIFVADGLGLPLSTTHVLSSGIAGTMVANRSGLQMGTVRNVLLAWVLTLPVCVFLGALLFALAVNVALAAGF